MQSVKHFHGTYTLHFTHSRIDVLVTFFLNWIKFDNTLLQEHMRGKDNLESVGVNFQFCMGAAWETGLHRLVLLATRNGEEQAFRWVI